MRSLKYALLDGNLSFARNKQVLLACLAVVAIGGSCNPAFGQWGTGTGGIYYDSGNVGIGTMTPVAPLQITSVSGQPAYMRLTGTGGAWAGIQFENTALSAPTYRWALYQGAGGEGGTALSFFNYTAYSDSVTITSTGNVGIGTDNPLNKLSVLGTIQANEVLVNTGWSDYVFAPGYRLAPLSEVAAYVKDHHHLPDIPSAAEVEEKGVKLGEVQAKLLAKVEELTLHMIEAEERSKKFEQENRGLQKRLEQLEIRYSGESQDHAIQAATTAGSNPVGRP